jgi:hypothetical protein
MLTPNKTSDAAANSSPIDLRAFIVLSSLR